jgi:nuclear pore complex protein Nup93
VVEQGAPLLRLSSAAKFNEHILARAAHASEQADRISEAIKLYNLAGQHTTVVSVLARALGASLSRVSADEQAHTLERTAAEVLRHYERTNRAAGREREAVVRLLRIREALDAKDAGRPEVALELMESTGLIPLDGDVGRITRAAEEFRELHEALQRNLQTYLTLTMDVIAGIHARVKAAGTADANRQVVSVLFSHCGLMMIMLRK